jgi:hypothetical protein
MNIKVLSASFLLLTAGLHAMAQQAVATEQTEVTKSEFSAMVTELGKLLDKDKKAEAEQLFTEINKLANAEFGSTREKMRHAQNEADKSRYSALTVNQRNMFAQVLKLRQENMVANKQQIMEKLEAFSATIE